jgi:glycosyltransferase involved in cell wall biosynthesis
MTTAPRVGIVGPLLGGNPGWVTSQGEVLAAHLQSDGLVVQTTSDQPHRVRRAVDILTDVRRWRGTVDVGIVLAYSGGAFAMTDLATRSLRRLDVPIVLWLHGGGLPRFVTRHPRWAAAVFDRASRVVAPSSYLADIEPGRERTATIIPNVIPEPAPMPEDRGTVRRILWMRTFHPLYRPELALETFALVLERFPDVRLTMAGQDKGSSLDVRRVITERGWAERVEVRGFLDPVAKAEVFATHDVFLNTSRVDNAPVSVLEAAAHGLVVVSTPAGGIGDLLPAGEAALFGEDAGDLAAAVERVLTDAALARRLAEGAGAVADRSRWASVGPQWHELLTGMVHGG